MDNSKVAIIIPVRNAEPFLRQCIDSALNQTGIRTEILAVDDGSDDGSPEILAECKKQGISVYRTHHSASGPSAARNLGLQQTDADWIQFLDADDWLEPNKIANQLNTSPTSDTVLISSRIDWRDNVAGSPIPPPVTDPGTPTETLLNIWLSDDRPRLVQTGQWLVHREVIEKAGGWDESLLCNNDGEFFTRCALAAKQVIPVTDSICHWRRHTPGQSVSTQSSFQYFESRLRSWRQSFSYLEATLAPEQRPHLNRAKSHHYSEIAFAAGTSCPKISEEALGLLESEHLCFTVSPHIGTIAKTLIQLLGFRTFRRLSRWKEHLRL